MPKLKSKNLGIKKEIHVFNSSDKAFHEKPIQGNLGYLPHPFRIAICAQPNAGKTNFAFNILLQHEREGVPFESIIVIHYMGSTTTEYEPLGDDVRMLDRIPENFRSLFMDLEEGDEETDAWMPEQKTIIIFDDMDYKHLNKDQASVFNRLNGCLSTHANISLIMTAQEPISIPVSVRRMINYVTLFKYKDTQTMMLLAQKFGLTRGQLDYIFEHICNKPHDALTLSYEHEPRLRKNGFEAIELPVGI